MYDIELIGLMKKSLLESSISSVMAGVRRVKDGEEVGVMQVKDVQCVTVFEDSRFIAAGSRNSDACIRTNKYLWASSSAD